MSDAGEPVFVQALVPDLAVEALDVRVIVGLAWSDERSQPTRAAGSRAARARDHLTFGHGDLTVGPVRPIVCKLFTESRTCACTSRLARLLSFKDEDVWRSSACGVDGLRQGLAIGRKRSFLGARDFAVDLAGY
jgi:hypothetical protein